MSENIYALKNVVLIGASAGGLQPLQQIISNLPKELKNTAIVIAQHTSPNFESMLGKLLSKNTAIPITEASDDSMLVSNHIYTCPADTNVSIVTGKFKFAKPNSVGPKPSVDVLFTSAAKVFGKEVIGIIISGTGHDGSNGIVAIKAAGGFTIAQSPETTTYSGMPESAILTENIDLILSPDEIGEEIPKLLDHDYRAKKMTESPEQGEDLFQGDSVAKVLELLQKRIGTDFSKYKKSTIHRRLDKRLKDRNLKTIDDYIAEIESNPKELDNLFLYLLIGVTQFFRNPESMLKLQEYLKIALSQLPAEKGFRVWIPGCATGEEAYSIAILINDLIENGSPQPAQIQIFATDIDQLPLNKARQGKFHSDSLKYVPQKYIDKYFHEHENFFYVNQEIKKHIIFSKHDVTTNPPFLRLNLISCRNLLIYFKLPLQNQLIPLFHYALEKDGLLFLGSSENIGKYKNLFDTIDHKHKIFRRKVNEVPVSHIPLLQPIARPIKAKDEKIVVSKKLTLSDQIKETLYNSYEHPYIVIDESYNIIEIYKEVSDFIKFQPGAPVLNALKLIDPKLRIDLRTLVTSTLNSMSITKGSVRKLMINKEPCYVRLKVQPVNTSQIGNYLIIVAFESVDNSYVVNEQAITEAGTENPAMIQLEQELLSTKEHLNTLVEELETSNEELQSLNEELQSSNEELQASNEELETSNEELQATNEELNVAYAELRKITERLELQSQKLKDSQNNLQSLLNNNQQAFILIDKNYVIISFNNFANKLFEELYETRLKEGAVYIEFLPPDDLAGFQASFKAAINGTQIEGEEEIIDKTGKKRYIAYNYTPVENASFSVDKVSLSFIDITESKMYEIEMQNAYKLAKEERELLKQIFEISPELIAIFSEQDYLISYANKNFLDLFKGRSILEEPVTEAIPEFQSQGLIEILNDVRLNGKTLQVNEASLKLITSDSLYNETYYFNFIYTPLKEPNRSEKSIVLIGVDITKEVNKRFRIEEEQEFLQMVSSNISEHIIVIQRDSKIEFINKSALEFYGDNFPTTLKELFTNIHPEDQNDFSDKLADSFKSNNKVRQEMRIRSKKGDWCWHLFFCQYLFGKLIISATDINDQKISQKNKDDFMGIASHELKTPLTTIKAYNQMLAEHFATNNDDSIAKMYVNRNLESIEKLEQFVSDLLDITRIQSGRLSLNKKIFSIDGLVRKVIQNLKLIHLGYEIELNYSGEEILVDGDETRIEQVMINLINNAVKYSPGENSVLVSLSRKIDAVEVSVKDHGIGISDEDKERVFDRFFRVGDQTKKISGMGIGLNISKEIINLHSGRIWFESKLNKGSIFYFTLPVKEDINEKNNAV